MFVQELVSDDSWRYSPSEENPDDDITQGLSLPDLANPNPLTCDPTFLYQPAAD